MSAIKITSSSIPHLESEHLDRIRLGILAFPLSAVLFIAGLLIRGPLIDPPTDPVAFAHNAVKPAFAMGAYGITLAWIILMLGFPALYAFLQTEKLGRWGFSGMIFSFLGAGLALPIMGVVAAAFPEVGTAYLRGEEMEVLLTALGITSNMTILMIFVLSVLLHTLGSVLFALGILRCTVLPTWAGFLYALHAPLIHFAPKYAMEIVGALLLLVSGAFISLSLWKRISVLHQFGDALKSPEALVQDRSKDEAPEDEEEIDEDIPPWERKKKQE